MGEAGPSNVVRASNVNDQSAMRAEPEARSQPLTLDDSPLMQKAYRQSMAKMIQPYSLLPPGFMPRSDLKEDASTENQQRMLHVQEAHSTNPDESMHQNYYRLFHLAQRTDEVVGEATPKAAPRRL